MGAVARRATIAIGGGVSMRRIPTIKRSLEKAPVRLKGEEHEGESNVMVGVDQGAVDAPLGDHAADIAAVGDATGVEGRILPGPLGQH